MNPLDYSLCDETVTVYRRNEGRIRRQVADNARLIRQTATSTENYGKSMDKKFLLIIPGDFPLQPGDRVFAGIGPEMVDWENFVPAAVKELYEISFAKPCYWDGEVVHWEAGNRKENL